MFCFANEAFFVCLYLAAYWVTPIAPHLPLPDFFLSSDLAKDHPYIFGRIVYALRHATWPQVVAALTFPIMAGKQIINVVQFWKASKIVRNNLQLMNETELIDSWSVSISQRGKQRGRPPLRLSVDLAVEGVWMRMRSRRLEEDEDEVLIDKYKKADEALIGERR